MIFLEFHVLKYMNLLSFGWHLRMKRIFIFISPIFYVMKIT